MKPGDVVRVKVKETGEKVRARIIAIQTDTEPIEVTMGGLFPGGPPPDQFRTYAPGRTTTTITLILDES